MNRSQLAHTLRAAATHLGDRQFVVTGSAAIFGSFPDALMNDDLALSAEVDLLPPDDEDGAKAVALDGAHGELSAFHLTHGFYIDGVSTATAKVAVGWEKRVVPFAPADANGVIGWCLSAADPIATKTVVGRQKHHRFAGAALRQRLVDPDETIQLIEYVPATTERRASATAFIKRNAPKASGVMSPKPDTSGVGTIPPFDALSFGFAISD